MVIDDDGGAHDPGDARVLSESGEASLRRFVEGTTPLVVGQAQRLMPFRLSVRGATVASGGLLSMRSMESGVSLLVCRDRMNLERLNVPDDEFLEITVQGRPDLPAPSVVPLRAPVTGDESRWIADANALGTYLADWLEQPDRALAALPTANAERLATELGGAELAAEGLAGAARFGLPLISPALLEADAGVLELLAPPMARRLQALPLIRRDGVLAVAVVDPARQGMLNQLEFSSGLRVALLLCSPALVERAIGRHYDRLEDRDVLRALGILGGREREGVEAVHEMERLSSEQPVVRLVHDLIETATRKRASDIHIRPSAKGVEVLYRIDGLLHVVRSMDRALLPAVVSRVKVLGGMNIAERRLPQDGRASFALQDRLIDLRISILPTVDGESVVIRLLDTAQSLRDLDSLGLSPEDTVRLRDLLARSHGMLLVTGPTGSGKSTTLYAALNYLRSDAINIVTVENPVEYHIGGVLQIQVNQAIGFNFAKSLRNILRHDPDVVMVGEIRDQETATIATEAALTGHLLLSTLHTNSAATTVTRLLDLGIEAFLLRSTLLGVLAQRLARRNCPHCLAVDTHDAHMAEVLGARPDESFFRGRGCPLCEGTGIAGRVAVYELMTVDAGARRLIEPHADADAIHRNAIEHGMTTISQHALRLARSGTITLGEAFRIHVD
jgi:type IV pilus assembly protein PilB